MPGRGPGATDLSAGRVLESVLAAERFLLARQSDDGLWRDYPELEPGASEAWVTAVVAWALTLPPVDDAIRVEVTAAADSLHAVRNVDGWGYNRHTASDADTTAWAWRFLSRIDDYRGLSAVADLTRFISSEGGVHTFDGEQYGAWAHIHCDVTPLVGLTLVAVQADAELVDRVRAASLASRDGRGLWPSYWWTSDAYATARNLEFLAARRGVPEPVKRRIREWLGMQSTTGSSSFDVAQQLAAAVRTGSPDADRFCRALLDTQAGDGGWPRSRTLLVPAQHVGEPASTVDAYADEQRLMSTAMALCALKGWLFR